MRFSGLLDILKSILARKNNFKEKKAEFLKNADLLLKGQKFIYSGFMDGIFDSSDIYASGREEDFSEKYDDVDNGNDNELYTSKELAPRDMLDIKSTKNINNRSDA